MRVSVIIPALNEEKNIEATLQSIRRQNYRHPIELIVADGHSTDKTVSIAKKYCDAVVQETTHTIAAGRQAGARAAHGELLLYTDADTLVDKDWVRNMAAAFDDERVAAAFGMIQPKEATGVEHFILTWGVYSMAAIFNALGTDYTYGNNMALRKTAFDKIGGFNIYLVTGEDTEIFQRVRHAGRVVFVPGAVAHYSIRRIRDWGYPRYLWFHTKNFFMTQLFKRPAQHYSPVRK